MHVIKDMYLDKATENLICCFQNLMRRGHIRPSLMLTKAILGSVTLFDLVEFTLRGV